MRKALSATLLIFLVFLVAPWKGLAQADEIVWSAPINISNSPEKTSTDPFLLADPAGYVHLFWTEKVSEDPGEAADTMFYTRWDGSQWATPVDIFLAPLSDGTPVVSYPHGVMDEKGNIHLVWLQEPNSPNYSVYYSSVPASQANSAKAWKTPLVLADDLTGSKYSIHIAYSPPQTLHVAFARVAMGDAIGEQRAVSYVRSTDGGETWSDPVDVFTAPSMDTGASDTRLLAVAPDRLFLTWTLWDDTGNGQVIYFARSMDNGITWSRPVRLAVRQGTEYERDWNNLVWLGGDRIGALWEGGYRAYRYGMYSNDNGLTWTEPVDTFPYLIGDNGYIEFARDSAGTQHLFLAQRIREGNEERGDLFGLWHSIYEGGARWSEPTLVTRDATAVKAMTNPKVAITNGNRVVAAWYGSGIYEIYVITGEINSAPAVSPTPWPLPEVNLEGAPALGSTPTGANPDETALVPAGTAEPVSFSKEKPSAPDQSAVILLGILPAAMVVLAFVVIQQVRSKPN